MHSQNIEDILAGPDIKQRTVGESQAKANRTRNSPEEVEVAGPHTSPTSRRHNKSSPGMEPPRIQITRPSPNNMAQNNPRRDQALRQNMEWSQSTSQKSSQMAILREGPMFPRGMKGNYIYTYNITVLCVRVCVCVCVCVRARARALTIIIPANYMQFYMLCFSTVRLWQGQETFLRNVQTGSGAHPASYSIGSGGSSGVKTTRV
jgi:hypothetical protein